MHPSHYTVSSPHTINALLDQPRSELPSTITSALEARNKGTKHAHGLRGSSTYNLRLTADSPAVKMYAKK